MMTVALLEIPFTYSGNEEVICPVALQSEQEIVLVDCGYPGFMPLIGDAMKQHQLSLQQLTGVIITHYDLDHLGGLAEIKKAYPHIKVYSSAIEENQINGREKSARLVQAENMQETLPEEDKAGGLQFIATLKAIQVMPVDYTFKDNDEPSFLKGVQIIYTPGHTPGHISIYVKDSKTLIAADAVVVENGVLEIANPQFTLDMQQAIESVKKITQLDIEKLICYHGGLVEKNINGQLRNLVWKYEGKEKIV